MITKVRAFRKVGGFRKEIFVRISLGIDFGIYFGTYFWIDFGPFRNPQIYLKCVQNVYRSFKRGLLQNGSKIGSRGGIKMAPKSNVDLIQNEIRTRMLQLFKKGSNSLFCYH